MVKRIVGSSLEEDLRILGFEGMSLVEQADIGGIPIVEGKSKCVEEDICCPKCESKLAEGKCSECGYEVEAPKDEDVETSSDEDVETPEQDESANEDVNVLDADEVSNELFDAIMGLPFDTMESEDVEALLEKLKSKTLAEDSDEALKDRASEVVDFLISEVKAKITRRAKSGKMGRVKSKQCPEGYRNKGGKCVRAAIAAGGKGKLIKQARMKAKKRKTGKGKASIRKSLRRSKLRAPLNNGVEESTFAMELASLVEDVQEEKITVRDSLLDQIGGILDMLSEEFEDEAVTRVFTESFELVTSSWDAGRLDEDVMNEDEFVAEIKPLLTLIHKSLSKINGDGDLKN